jgi:septum formation protein
MRVVLASGSPRRKKLLNLLIDDFEVLPSNIKEEVRQIHPRELVKQIAKDKGRAVSKQLNEEGCLIISADTMVALKENGEWRRIGKADSKQEAKELLLTLSGRRHFVYTGLYFLLNGREELFVEESMVWFRDLEDKEIDSYLEKAVWQDKAGAYAIQEEGGAFVKQYQGSLSNIWGFPLKEVSRHLKSYNIKIKSNWSDQFKQFVNKKQEEK